jgi:signal transduction histidine kinase
MSVEEPHDQPLIEAVAAGIAHEVRNPLNALQINLQILEQELGDLVPDRGSHVYSVLGKIAREVQSLDKFVSEFLRFARPPRLTIERVHVRPLLADLAAFVAPECTRKGVALRTSLDGGPSTVLADGFQLKHVVLNLVLNALQATAAGGRITLETSGDTERLLIEVRDSGEGMTEETQARIFDVFFTMREGGTGLGLPIARRIVEQHGGELRVTSALGDGTRATIILPPRPGA